MTDARDAKDLWCPFARVLFSDEDGAAGFNRRGESRPEKTAPCLGAGCAAWRDHPPTVWHDFPTQEEADAFAVKQDADVETHGPEEGFGEGWSVEVGKAGGFCGLAGAAGAR